MSVSVSVKKLVRFIFNLNFLSNYLFSPWNGWKRANINEYHSHSWWEDCLKSHNPLMMFPLLRFLSTICKLNEKCINIYEPFPTLVCWSLKESNLVVVIVFSPQNFSVAPAEYTTSSVSFSLFQWGNLSLLIINKKIIPCDGHWPRTPCLPN